MESCGQPVYGNEAQEDPRPAQAAECTAGRVDCRESAQSSTGEVWAALYGQIGFVRRGVPQASCLGTSAARSQRVHTTVPMSLFLWPHVRSCRERASAWLEEGLRVHGTRTAAYQGVANEETVAGEWQEAASS